MRTWKKILTLILALMLALSMAACSTVQSAIGSITGKEDPIVAGNKPAGDHSGDTDPGQGGQQQSGQQEQQGNVTWSLEGGVLTISGSGPMESIPIIINGIDYTYKWNSVYSDDTSVTRPWSMNNNERESITSIVIEPGVTTIGCQAFRSCVNLSSVTIPDTVTTIDYGAFFCCTNLTNVTIPESVTMVNSDAFGKCENLTSIIIPNSVTVMGASVFQWCTSLTDATIGTNVETFDALTFVQCQNLKSLTILGQNTEIYGGFEDVPDFTIYAPTGSLAEEYCKNLDPYSPHITFSPLH